MDYIQYNADEKIRVVFLYQVASFWPSWESLYRTLLQDPRFEVKLIYLYVEGKNEAQTETAQRFLMEKGLSYEGFDYEKIISFRPHYMFFQTPYDKGHRGPEEWSFRFKRHGIRVVYIPYGIEISDTKESQYKHFSLAVPINANLIYVLSEDIKKEYEKHSFNAGSVRALGLPRFDLLADKENFPLDQSIKERLRGRKKILWKVHFPKIFKENGEKKQATPKLEEYLAFIDYIKEQKDVFFIFMPHPKFCDNTIDETLRPLAEEIISRLAGIENVSIDQGDDYRPSLVNADGIIIDRSAVMIEAGAVDVPVLYMYNPDYHEPMTDPIQRMVDSYHQGTNAGDMRRFVDMTVNGRDWKENERRKEFSRCVPFFRDKSCEKIRDNLITELACITKDTDRKIVKGQTRIILFGTGYIFRWCRSQLREQITKLNIIAVVDNNAKRHYQPVKGVKEGPPILVRPPKVIDLLDYDYIVITSDVYYEEMYRQLRNEYHVAEGKILSFDNFVVLSKFED